MSAPVRIVRLVHPFPSLVNAGLVLGLALIAGAPTQLAAVLAAAMLGLQFCIGAVNDVVDERIDAQAKPWKPIPSGLVSRRAAIVVAVIAGGGGLLMAASVQPLVLLLAASMLACGLAYDLFLKPTAWAWACFALAFPLLPVYAWYGAAGTWPPGAEFLLPLAALAGPVLQLSNGLSDLESDHAAGLATLATRLGRRGALLAIVGLLVVIHALAWLTVVRSEASTALLIAGAATGTAVIGVALSASERRDRREIGWMVQAGSIALLGLGWLGAAV